MIGASTARAMLLAVLFITSRSAADEATAKDLFARGRVAAAAGDCDRALKDFELSYQEQPAVGTLLNISACEEKLGRLHAATLHLGEALEHAEPADPRRTLIAQRMDQIRERFARVQVRLSTALPADATLTIDAIPVERSRWTNAIELDPGVHRLVCATPNAQLCDDGFSLAEGEAAVRDVLVSVPTIRTPTDVPATPSLPDLPHPATAAPSRAVPLVFGAIGAVVLAGGLVAGAVAWHEKGVQSRHCDATGCDEDGMQAARAGKVLATVSTIASLVGAGTLGASAYVLLTSSRGPTAGLTLSGSF